MEPNTQPSAQPKTRVAIIGGGLAGLAAARALQGKAEVTLFEKSKALGGRAETVVKDGFSLNQGAHALYQGGYAHQFLTEHQIDVTGGPPASGQAKAVVNGILHDLPISLNTILATGYLSVLEKFELAVVFRRIAKVASSIEFSVSLSQWLQSNVRSPKVRATTRAFARLSSYTNDPDNHSARALLEQISLSSKGVIYLNNGWQSIINGLKASCDAKLLFLSEVIKVESVPPAADTNAAADANSADVFNRGPLSVHISNSVEYFDAVVLAVPPKVASKLLNDDKLTQQFARITPTYTACYDICLNQLPMKNRTFALGIDESLYFSVHSVNSELAPTGGALIHLASYLKPGERGDERHKQRLQALLDQMQPGWRKSLVYERFLPNMISTFGEPRTDFSGHVGAASPALTAYPSVYVCGDWVGSGHLLADAAVRSADDAVRALLVNTLRPLPPVLATF